MQAMRITSFLVSLLVIACAASCASQSAPVRETDSRVAERYDGVASRIFGAPIDEDGLAPDVAWVVTVRRRAAGNDEPEVQFSITRSYTGGLSATVMRLREPLEGSGAIDRVHLIAAGCRGLETIAEEFSGLQLSPVLENGMILDPIQYQVWVDAGSQQASFNLLGPSSGEGGHPLIVWIEGALRELARCEGRSGE